MMRNALLVLGQLSDEDFEWLLESGAKRRLSPNEVLIHEGRSIEGLSIIVEGELAVTHSDDREVARLGPGEFVGEISFVDQRPPLASVRSVRHATLLEIPRQALSDKLAYDHVFAARFYRALAMLLADRLRHTVRRMSVTNSDTPAGVDDIDSAVLERLHVAGALFERLRDNVLERPS
ncbi:DNA-binding transcriptional dual regulator Crp [Planctomycetes bacterium Pan216]|uniref:DNA-binding transcriptional dual regulator Crp n=1 Tax=Kolteria novifilia TaxID=2527975 RepID=A0A518BAG3_9BACT|nr:DNA-binding transcriptional dual regulator Crp [Planctomycetes bacterium Pan216]